MTHPHRWFFCLALALFLCRAAVDAESIRGSVVDSGSRTGIASASVQLKASPGGALSEETTTNEKGQFVFENVVPGKYAVSAAKDGYVAGAAPTVTVPEKDRPDVLLPLVRAASIAGTVMDSAGHAARGAKVVVLERRVEQGRARLAAVGFAAIVDDRGVYRLHGLAPGSYTLAVTPPMSATGQASFAPLYYPGVVQSDRAEWFTLRPGEARSGVDLMLRETTSYAVSGMVTGVPAEWRGPHVVVTITPVDGFGSPIATVTADSSHRFRFAAVPPGNYEVTASGPVVGRAPDDPVLATNPRRASRRIEVGGDEVRGIELPLGADNVSGVKEEPQPKTGDSKLQKCSISGNVLDATSKTPIAEAEVTVVRAARMPQQVRADAKGHYELNDLEAGDYDVIVRKEGYSWDVPANPRRIHLAPAQQFAHADFTLRKGATLSGRVLDEDDKPVSGVAVVIRGPVYDNGKLLIGIQRFANTNDLGEYRFTDLPEGPQILMADPKRFRGHKRPDAKTERPAQLANIRTYYMNSPSVEGAAPLTLTAGEQREGVDLVLSRVKTYCVSASIPQAATSPQGAFLSLSDSSMRWVMSMGGARLRGREETEICGFAPGTYELYATIGDEAGATGFARVPFHIIDRHVRLGPLHLPPPRPLPGKVIVEGAEPGAEIPTGVYCISRPKDRGRYSGEDLSTAVPASGSFTIQRLFPSEYWFSLSGLPPGHYVKEARCGSQNPKLEPIRSDCGELQFVLASDGATVSGQTLDAGNQPVTGATVVLAPAVLPESGLPGLIRTQETDQNGEFHLTGVAPGEYRVLAFTGLLPGEGEYPKFLRHHWTRAIELNAASRGAHRLSPVLIPVESGIRARTAFNTP